MRRRQILLPCFLTCSIALLLLASGARTQEEDGEDEADDDDDVGGDSSGGYDNYDGGSFFPMGSENFEELPGGVYDSDDLDSEQMDFMDSRKNPSVTPRFSLPSLMRMRRPVHPNGLFSFDHHNRQQEDLPSPAFNHDPDLLKVHAPLSRDEDAYDPERRRRYTGYDEEHEDSPGTQADPRQTEGDLSQDYDRFPRGSFYPLSSFHTESRHLHDRLHPSFRRKVVDSMGVPCDSGCDESTR